MSDPKAELDKKFNEFLKKIKPMDDRLLVEPVEEDVTTASGIVLPDTHSKERPQKGRVLAVGPGKLLENGQRVPMTVKVGDTVLYSKYGPTEVKLEGKEIFFVEESSVLAVVNA
ncbi:co-chaperone GroES [Candidatus Peregrinibacteria bacterium CG11_big_fil_rev_8_21_14_0_20_46_8]|nr:MAG: co-chaperone GroES [Candidatus Peregrinibacteria bacterium CG11_big_fil_rev_8_21_14_0_20_46_8]